MQHSGGRRQSKWTTAAELSVSRPSDMPGTLCHVVLGPLGVTSNVTLLRPFVHKTRECAEVSRPQLEARG